MQTNTIPDRLSAEPHSPFYDPNCANVGVNFDGKNMPGNVVEYCVSESWIRQRLYMSNGKVKRERGRPVAVKKHGSVVPYWKGGKAGIYRDRVVGEIPSEQAVNAAVEKISVSKTYGEMQDSASPWQFGARVTWSSNGKVKVGEISHVVPCGQLPADVGAKVKDASASPRDHESFVVQADGKNYWPRVSLLKLA